MAKTPPGWAPNQVVAHNMTRARELRGFTQNQVADRLSQLSGSRWSQATVAQAEASIHGTRMRNFTINELYALARTFDLPVLWFLIPPDPDHTDQPSGASFPDEKRPGDWRRLILYALGHRGNYGHLAQRMSHWYNYMLDAVTVPQADLVGDDTNAERSFAGNPTDRQAMTSDDALVAALYGLTAQALPGRPLGPDQIRDLSDAMHGLGTALDALGNYRPARVFTGQFHGSSREADDAEVDPGTRE